MFLSYLFGWIAVPIAVIASTKKTRSLINDNDLLAQALKSSSKLVLTEDGNKVKRKIPFTDKHREELQSRIAVVENLPDDHSHQNVQKIFSVVGSAKTIRICHPQESNSSRSKNDFFVTNKLHALVELETRVIIGRGQIICARGMLAPPKCGCTPQCESSAKQTSKGPRMPDGTKGFTVGRGKPPLVTQV